MDLKNKFESPKRFIAVSLLVIILIIGIFVYFIFPILESSTVAGFVGVLIGSLASFLSSIVSSYIGIWKTSKDSEERLKDRISNHALELTRMDYELRQKAIELSKSGKQFLAPAKVYRTFYKALYELHTTGNWPQDVEDLGLLNVFELSYNDGKR